MKDYLTEECYSRQEMAAESPEIGDGRATDGPTTCYISHATTRPPYVVPYALLERRKRRMDFLL